MALVCPLRPDENTSAGIKYLPWALILEWKVFLFALTSLKNSRNTSMNMNIHIYGDVGVQVIDCWLLYLPTSHQYDMIMIKIAAAY